MNNGRRLILRNKDYKDFKKNQEASLRDYLTGLPSRRALYEHYSMLSHNSTIHMMFIDIDNFKRVNDTYGHSEGDKLLCSVSNLLTTIMEDQRVYRIGGDEFIVMVDGSVAEGDLIEKVETILDTLHDMDFRKDILSLISLSIGIVFEQNNSQMLDELLNKCDSAMYQAKIDGKNRYVLYRALEKEMETNRLFESEMETALATGQFKVFLQPNVNMLNSKLEGAEALARWVHPQDGVRAPIQFIPLFEKNGFIIRLDLFIFEEVCRIKNSWKGTDLEHLKVSTNMSRLHLYQRDFPDVLKGIADKYDIPTCEIEIEITESTFFKDTGELIRMVEALEYNGFSVSIDDFGSGYSALNMLKDIPVETIKIERNFLRLSSNDLRGKKVIKNIIIMCKELKLNIVAEGVETKEHIEFLTSCGCEVAQGFYYSKPVPVEQFVEFSKEYLNNGYKPTHFTFNETLSSDDGEYTASYHIDSENPVKYEFVSSPFRGRKAVRLPGGVTETSCFSIPEKVLSSENFTISMWIKINELTTWGSAIYIKHETGFASIIPHAWEGHSTFRIRDSKNVNGWHDTAGCQFPVGVWVHTAAIYNAKTETTVFMINGDVLATSENVPTQRFVKRILLGSDVFQNSIKADICELKLYNDVKSPVEIKEMFEEYTSEPDFIQPWETE